MPNRPMPTVRKVHQLEGRERKTRVPWRPVDQLVRIAKAVMKKRLGTTIMELVARTDLTESEARMALNHLVAQGLATSYVDTKRSQRKVYSLIKQPGGDADDPRG